MAYILNSNNLDDMGFIPGHMPESNIALAGCFDFPARIGKTSHSWGDEDGVEPWVAEGELFYGGRDITYVGHLFGTRSSIYASLQSLYDEVSSEPSGTVVFETPYGNFNVYTRSIVPVHLNGSCSINIIMREPVVTITGGSVKGAASGSYRINDVPMSSYGLLYSGSPGIISLPEMKDQNYTAYQVEGFQKSNRQSDRLILTGVLTGATLSTFLQNLKDLYAVFSATGTMEIELGDVTVTCFAEKGFQINRVVVETGGYKTVAGFASELTVISMV